MHGVYGIITSGIGIIVPDCGILEYKGVAIC